MIRQDFLKEKAREYPRIAALPFMALGLLIFYLSFLKPLKELDDGVPDLQFSIGGAVFGAMTVLISAAVVLTGRRLAFVLDGVRELRSSRYKYGFIGFFTVVGAVLYLLLEHLLESHGYTIH